MKSFLFLAVVSSLLFACGGEDPSVTINRVGTPDAGPSPDPEVDPALEAPVQVNSHTVTYTIFGAAIEAEIPTPEVSDAEVPDAEVPDAGPESPPDEGPPCEPSPEDCFNDVDDDCDGLTDMKDYIECPLETVCTKDDECFVIPPDNCYEGTLVSYDRGICDLDAERCIYEPFFGDDCP